MIKISGRERSGTTWLEMLLRHNFICGEVDVRMKHHYTGSFDAGEKLIVVITKHPLDWWYSYTKYAYLDFSSQPDTLLFNIWNTFHELWIAYAQEHPLVFLRYQDLYKDPEEAMKWIPLKRNDEEFDPIAGIVTPDCLIGDKPFDRNIGKIIEAYDNNLHILDKVTNSVDKNVMEYLGYHTFDLEENEHGNN